MLFWSDHWQIGNTCTPLQERFPRLYSFCLHKNLSVMEVFQTDNFQELFYLPLSELAFQEFHQLSSLMESCQLDNSCPDAWVWRHGKQANYSSKKFHDFVYQPVMANPILKWVWKSCCTMSIKMFAWLVIMDRVNTKDMIQRRHWRINDGPECVLCPTGTLEDRNHLFFQCNCMCVELFGDCLEGF